MSLNHYMFSGFLVKPPVTLEDEATGKPYLRFRLEGRKNVKTKAPYNFIDFVARGKVAEFCYNYLIVGQYITVEGEISSRPFSANGHAIALPELIALRVWNDRSRDVPIDTTKAEKDWEQFWNKYDGFDANGAYKKVWDQDENPLTKVKTKDDFWDKL